MKHGSSKVEGKKAKDLICVAALDPGTTTGLAYMVFRESWVDKVLNTEYPNDLPASVRILNQSMRIKGWCDVVEVMCRDEMAGVGHILSGLAVLKKRYGLHAVVTEAFQNNPYGNRGRSGKKSLLAPVRITAGLELGLKEVVKWKGTLDKSQTASQAKGVISNDRLRRWGLWKGYSNHERDAIRHLLLYMRRAIEKRDMLIRDVT